MTTQWNKQFYFSLDTATINSITIWRYRVSIASWINFMFANSSDCLDSWRLVNKCLDWKMVAVLSWIIRYYRDLLYWQSPFSDRRCLNWSHFELFIYDWITYCLICRFNINFIASLILLSKYGAKWCENVGGSLSSVSKLMGSSSPS